MLKVVGTEYDEIVDEKVIITDEGRITKFGVMLICLDILADIGIFVLISKIVKIVRK